MEQNPLGFLIIGLFVAFGVGFFVGSTIGQKEVVLPSNWDPSASALKATEEQVRLCYQILVDHVSSLKTEVSKLDCKKEERISH